LADLEVFLLRCESLLGEKDLDEWFEAAALGLDNGHLRPPTRLKERSELSEDVERARTRNGIHRSRTREAKASEEELELWVDHLLRLRAPELSGGEISSKHPRARLTRETPEETSRSELVSDVCLTRLLLEEVEVLGRARREVDSLGGERGREASGRARGGSSKLPLESLGEDRKRRLSNALRGALGEEIHKARLKHIEGLLLRIRREHLHEPARGASLEVGGDSRKRRLSPAEKTSEKFRDSALKSLDIGGIRVDLSYAWFS
jgi:hypothetical protein